MIKEDVLNKQLPSWLSSAIFHMIVIIILALWILPGRFNNAITLSTSTSSEYLEMLDEMNLPTPVVTSDWEASEKITNVVGSIDNNLNPSDLGPDFNDMVPGKIGNNIFPSSVGDLITNSGGRGGKGGGGPLGGRGDGYNKRKGTPEGDAVALALRWLAAHQFPDGGWSFDHTMSPLCQNQCRDRDIGNKNARIGATGMALLPFLGAGQTHMKGDYQKTVRGGLYFLISNMKLDATGGSLRDEGGNMYSHGIASIVLCEAFAMSNDKALRIPAQQSINFICYAQDPVGGGWRYQPRERGDTSVVGWQIMALKSGHMAYLIIPPETVQRVSAYFDAVQYESGSRYGYTDPNGGSKATTAIGLLCRMYLGWSKDHPALERGAEWLANTGPSKGDMYYNYYATQVMRHHGGDNWEKWDEVMKPQLVNSQAKEGHETGSWITDDPHGKKAGGRLYCTSMAAMVLEVYYRHLPLYKTQSVEEEFPE